MAVPTIGEWLAKVQPPPPDALAARLRDALGNLVLRPESDVPEVLLEAGEQLLRSLLSSGSTSRATALDLLAVDSLVTYAFEAASGEAVRLDDRAARAMSRIASIPSELPA